MATLAERSPGVWCARTFLPPTRPGEKGRQVGKTFKGSKKAVRAEVAEWEANLKRTAPQAVGATVADLLELWQQAKGYDWQPTTARDYRSRARMITADIGHVRIQDLDPFCIDGWLAQMRREGVGEGAINARVGAMRSALSWGVSRRMLRNNPISEAKPKTQRGPLDQPRPRSGRGDPRSRQGGGHPRRVGVAVVGRRRRPSRRGRRPPVG